MMFKTKSAPNEARCWAVRATLSSSWGSDLLNSHLSGGGFSRAFKAVRNSGCNSHHWARNKP